MWKEVKMNAFHMLFYLADFCHFFVTIFLPKLCLIFHIKVAVSRDFLTIFYFMNDESSPPGPLINRLKWFSWKIICFRGYIRMLSSKIWLPPRRARQGDTCKYKIDVGKTPRSVRLCGVWLRQLHAVLATFWFSENVIRWLRIICAESDSTQC